MLKTSASTIKYKKEVQKIIDQIVNGYEPEKVILFGSAVSGKLKKKF